MTAGTRTVGHAPRIVLVHGAWHRAASWAGVADRLRAAGHDVVAVDLPAESAGLGARAYADRIAAAAGPGPVVLAAHSLGGLTAPVAAARIGPGRVRGMVLVAAFVPAPGRPFADRLRAEPATVAAAVGRLPVRHPDGTTAWRPHDAETVLYGGVADEDWEDWEDREDDAALPVAAERRADGPAAGTPAAARRVHAGEPAGGTPADGRRARVAHAVAGLRRQDWTVLTEPSPLAAWPPVPTEAVVCREDRIVDPAIFRRSAEAVGARIVEIDGGHFPMLTRPGELARILARAAGG